MYRIVLTQAEIEAIQPLLNDLASRYRTVEDPEFIHNLSVYAHELPRRLRSFLNDFRLKEPDGVCIVSGYPIDDSKVGKTPEHWKWKADVSPALHEEMFFMLCGSLLGDIFGWSTQQDGYILHDVMPIKGHEGEQLGTGSEQKLWWHTEDAFHPYKGDYVALMCMRNPDQVPTTVLSADMLRLNEEYLRILREPRYTIRPDESHLPKNQSNVQKTDGNYQRLIEGAYERINKMNTEPQKVPVIFGDPDAPYMCLDPYFMDLDKLDDESRQALEALMKEVDEGLVELVLQPGDCCFIDNYRAVHGRSPFKAHYDGTDRWLKRINITRNLRHSRDARLTAESRIIF
ncbi:MAG TPA: guanitoxin biosynthesis L-enduracididine beta-hydroxylase GntD [Herpetosiphonaceae bacterium]